LREEKPDISVTLFYEKMFETGALSKQQASYSSVYRLLKRLDMAGNRQRKEPERKRFQFEKVNHLWQADLSQGPYLRLGKKKVETHLFAFIDDASRLVPYAAFSTDQTFDSLKTVFKEALLRRGVPSVLYSDNGKIYRSQQLQWVCASLGIALVHTRPYDPAAKGKIERFFLTVKQRFIQGIEQSALCSLDSLNNGFHAWLERDYNHKPHSAIAMAPLDFYLSQVSSLKMLDDPSMLEPLFLRREHRKVRHDATISIRNALFEAPPRFIGQSVEVRFDPSDLSEVFIYENGSQAARMAPVNLLDNALVKRDASLRLSQLAEQGE
jgi:transposase InsO family protein